MKANSSLEIYGKNAFDVIVGICKSCNALTYQRSTYRDRLIGCFEFKHNSNNEISVEYDSMSWRLRKHIGSLKAIKDTIAFYLKDSVKSRGLDWLRTNTEEITFNTSGYNEDHEWTESSSKIKVCDIYFIYDCLRGRKNIEKKYSSDVVERLRGEAYDPIRSEQMSILEDELKTLSLNRKSTKEKLESEKWMKISESRDKITDEYSLKLKLVDEEYSKKVEELKKTMLEMAS